MLGETEAVDVAVVGAGLAGLTAARHLQRAGLAVTVFEAADTVGGRTRAGRLGELEVDTGASFVGPTQTRILDLVAEFGLTLESTFDVGKNVIGWHGRRFRYGGTTPRLDPLTLAGVAMMRARLDRLAPTVPLGRPWTAHHARSLDAQTFGAWIKRSGANGGARELMRIATQVSWGCEPEEVSLLHVLHFLHGAGGLDALLGTREGAQESHIREGAHAIAHRLAAELADVVRCGAPVTGIRWQANGALVRVGEEEIAAGRVVLAMSPSVRGRIQFDPVLPTPWSSVAQRWFHGPVSKVYALYERPFWRDEQLSGQGLLDAGPVTIAFDMSPHSGSVGVLLGFVAADHARAWDALDAPERRIQALSSFATLFGDAALNPTAYRDHRWSQESWVGYGSVAAAAPLAWSSVGQGIAEPIGCLHWAGTETADVWTGFMEGAIRSGERVAGEVEKSHSRSAGQVGGAPESGGEG